MKRFITLTVAFTIFNLVSTSGIAQPPDSIWSRTFGGPSTEECRSVQQTLDGGYVLAGYTNSVGIGRDFFVVKTDANGVSQWTRNFGGPGVEECRSVQQTSDGGYISGGYTESFGAGTRDFWLVKIDLNGNQQWSRSFGGPSMEECCSVQQTTDGGYILAGYSDSYGIARDFWLVKTDVNGNQVWSRNFGGSGAEECYAVRQTSDGGYILAGHTFSYGAGNADIWLVKTDANGNLLWNRTFGNTSEDKCYSVKQTSEGGYVLSGSTQSPATGNVDLWLIKTDAGGSQLWSRTYGGTGNDASYSLQQTADGGYVLAGYTGSFGAGSFDFWIIKTDASGLQQWTRTYGGFSDDGCYSVQQTLDGGFVLAGYTMSIGAGGRDFWLIKMAPAIPDSLWSRAYGALVGDLFQSLHQTSDGGYMLTGTIYNPGSPDGYIVKTDVGGNEQWNRTFVGNGDDRCYSAQQTGDGGYVLAGFTTAMGSGMWDMWLVKTDGSGNQVWTRTFGGAGQDVCYSVQQTADGGYVLAGYTSTGGDPMSDGLLVKTDGSGNLLWTRTFTGTNEDRFYSVRQTVDGGYILAGYTWGTGNRDFWLVKTDGNGLLMWSRTFGGSSSDECFSVQQTTDGGYILVGKSFSDVLWNWDARLVKTDGSGGQQWSRVYGGSSSDEGHSVQQASNGGYVFAGTTWSSGSGGMDFWLVRTDASGNQQWARTFGGAAVDECAALQQASDGGYILCGRTDSFQPRGLWLVKTGSDGQVSPPSQTTIVSASDSNCTNIVVTWTDVSRETGYRVYRDNLQIGNTLANLTTYTDYPSPGSHSYRIVAFNTAGDGSTSGSDNGVRQIVASIPQNVTATTGLCDRIHVQWMPIGLAYSFKVYRNGILLTNTSSIFYDDLINTSGIYTVSAVSTSGPGCESAQSPPVNGLRLVAPSQVTNLSASDNHCSDIQLTWLDVSNEIVYKIYRNGLEIGITGINVTSYIDAPPAGTYSYMVRAINVCGEGAYSESDSGTRLSVPPTVNLVSPMNGAIIVSGANTAFCWNSQDVVVAYHLQWDEDSNFGSPIEKMVSDTCLKERLCEAGTWFWRVRGENLCGTDGWSTVWTFIVQGPPKAYVTVETSGPPVWNYRLNWISGCVSELYFTRFCPGTTGMVTGEAAQAGWLVLQFPYRIEFRCPESFSMGSIAGFTLSHPYCSDIITWSAGDSTGTIDGPLPVELLSFTATSTADAVTLQWSVASETDNNYFIIERNGDLIHYEPSLGNTVAGHTYSYTDVNVISGATYTYELGSMDQNGNSADLAELSVRVHEVEVLPDEFALRQNYPNPFNPATQIAYDMKNAEYVTVKVYDLLGREVSTLVHGDVDAGRHTVTFDGTGLPSGVYICRMRTADFEAQTKMLLMK